MKQNSYIFIQENALETVVCEMTISMCQHQYSHQSNATQTCVYFSWDILQDPVKIPTQICICACITYMKLFWYYWPFVGGNHRWLVNFILINAQLDGAFVLSLLSAKQSNRRHLQTTDDIGYFLHKSFLMRRLTRAWINGLDVGAH